MKVLDFIGKWMGEFLILAIFVGFFMPFLSFFRPVVSWMLMFLLFSSFLNLDFKIHKFLRKELIIFPLLCWIILPFILVNLTHFLSIDFRIGFFLILITPPALGSPIIVRLAKGDLEFSIANLVIYNLLSPFVYAILPGLFFKETIGASSAFTVFKSVALYIFIPLILSIPVKKTKIVKSFILDKIDPFKGIIQLFMIAVVVASSVKQINSLEFKQALIIFLSTFILSFILYLLGYLLCFSSKKERLTCAISSGHKNTLLSIVTGMSNFNLIVTLPTVFYLISHHIWNGLVIRLSKR